MQIFGHRGAAGIVAENTLASLRFALELGVDGIEFDVRSTSDGVPVLLHDDTLDRTTAATGPVSAKSWHALSGMSCPEDEKIPALCEVFERLDIDCRVNVELKDPRAVEAAIQVLRSAVSAGRIEENQLLISSFDWASLRVIRDAAPEFALGLLTRGLPEQDFWETAAELNVVTANIDLPSVTPAFVACAHQAQLEVMVYTVNDPQDLRNMVQWEVDAIFTDFPNQLLACER